jgi:outer membrane beta-barrel protein
VLCAFRDQTIKALFYILFGIFPVAVWSQAGMSDLERQLLLGESSSQIPDSPAYSQDPAPEVLAPPPRSRDLEKIEQAIAGPERIPYEQILVVQRRFILKEDRQEITPFYLGVQPADSFRRQFQWGFSWAYHLTESFGIEALHAAFMTNYSTGLDESIEKESGLKTDFGLTPVVVLGSSLIWTPFKSKAATRSEVYHFETYFNLGGGIALGETSKDPIGIFGVGFRAYLNRRSLLKVEIRDYMQFSGSSRHRVSLMLGGGILL